MYYLTPLKTPLELNQKPLFIGMDLGPYLGAPPLRLTSLLSFGLRNASCLINDLSHLALLGAHPLRLMHKPFIHHEVLQLRSSIWHLEFAQCAYVLALRALIFRGFLWLGLCVLTCCFPILFTCVQLIHARKVQICVLSLKTS